MSVNKIKIQFVPYADYKHNLAKIGKHKDILQ